MRLSVIETGSSAGNVTRARRDRDMRSVVVLAPRRIRLTQLSDRVDASRRSMTLSAISTSCLFWISSGPLSIRT